MKKLINKFQPGGKIWDLSGDWDTMSNNPDLFRSEFIKSFGLDEDGFFHMNGIKYRDPNSSWQMRRFGSIPSLNELYNKFKTWWTSKPESYKLKVGMSRGFRFPAVLGLGTIGDIARLKGDYDSWKNKSTIEKKLLIERLNFLDKGGDERVANLLYDTKMY